MRAFFIVLWYGPNTDNCCPPVKNDIPELSARGILSCIAIFWRTLDWRTFRKEEWLDDEQSWKPKCRENWKADFAFSDSHKEASLLARRGTAMWIIYQSGLGYARLDTPEQLDPPPKATRLGDTPLLQHFAWIPHRYRIQFAQIFHFALAVLVARLNMDHVPYQFDVVCLKYWLVEDLRSFAGGFLSRQLATWLDEVERRVLAGEDLFNNFDFQPDFVESVDQRLQYSRFGCDTDGLFFHVRDVYHSNEGEYDISCGDLEAAKF